MDGRGRCLDNIFIERLWRSLKYEEIYLRDYTLVPEARRGIGNWFRFYNQQRSHQSLDYRTPAELYRGKKSEAIRKEALPNLGALPPDPRGLTLWARMIGLQ